MSHSIVSDETSFSALAREWEDLFQRAAARTPFLRYQWLRLCWDCQKDVPGTKLHIIVVRDGGRATLIAPFVLQSSGALLRDLAFLDSLTPQYNDLLIENSDRGADYVDYLCDVISATRNLRHFVSAWVPEGSRLLGCFEKIAEKTKEASFKTSFIDLAEFGSWDAYLKSLTRKLRRDHGRQLRNLEARGPVRFCQSDASSLDRDIAWLFTQKRQWLEGKRRSSAWLRAPATEVLFAEAAREGLSSNRTWLTTLSRDHDIVAAMLSFREGSTLYLSKIAHDPSWRAYSPGRTLLLLTIQRALEHGLTKCDLMTGRSDLKESLATGSSLVFNHKVWLRKRAGFAGWLEGFAHYLPIQRRDAVQEE